MFLSVIHLNRESGIKRLRSRYVYLTRREEIGEGRITLNSQFPLANWETPESFVWTSDGSSGPLDLETKRQLTDPLLPATGGQRLKVERGDIILDRYEWNRISETVTRIV